MNFSAVFSELFILAYLVWNFLLQLPLLSDFQLPPLWCLTLCSYWKCSSLSRLPNPWNTLLWPHSLSQLRAFLKTMPSLPSSSLQARHLRASGCQGLGEHLSWEVCCFDLPRLSSARYLSFPLKPSWYPLPGSVKSWANLQGICHVCTKL